MKVVRSQADARALLQDARRGGRSLALVPTMGALHEGHLSLIRSARDSAAVVVVSIFVNPLQFGAGEDFESYPRDEPNDLAVAEGAGVDVAFVPSVKEMYPDGISTAVKAGEPAETLEGEWRPGHFDGVCTLVAKLFNVVQPDLAFFGQKDAQQVAVVKRMVVDLSYGIEVVACATARDPDGLALSSRNAFLLPDELARATVLWRSLQRGQRALEAHGLEASERAMWETLASEDGVVPDYARAVEPESFGPPQADRAVLLVVAARVGGTRLIDNLLVEPARGRPRG